MTQPPKPQPPYVALVVCATIVVLALIVGFVALVLYAPPETDLVKLIGAVGAALALVATQVANYLKTRQAATAAEEARQVSTSTDGKVTDLTNGLMDAKIRAAVSEVLQPHMVNPDVEAQLQADKVRRDTHV